MRSTDPKSWCLTFCFSGKFSKQWNSKLEKEWGYKDYGGIAGPFFMMEAERAQVLKLIEGVYLSSTST